MKDIIEATINAFSSGIKLSGISADVDSRKSYYTKDKRTP